MLRDILDLLAPAAFVHAIGLEAAFLWDPIETRLGDDEERAAGLGFEPEFDESGGLLAVIDVGIDGIGVPPEGEGSLGLNLLHRHFPWHVFVAGIRDLAPRHPTGLERAIELDAKPLAELAMVREGAPDAGNRRLEFDPLLDAIAHAQPPGCV